MRIIPGLSALPWRDPHAAPQEKLQGFIAALQEACSQYADTCLSIAYAMNHDVNRSMDALERAGRIESKNLLPHLSMPICTIALAPWTTQKRIPHKHSSWPGLAGNPHLHVGS